MSLTWSFKLVELVTDFHLKEFRDLSKLEQAF